MTEQSQTNEKVTKIRLPCRVHSAEICYHLYSHMSVVAWTRALLFTSVYFMFIHRALVHCRWLSDYGASIRKKLFAKLFGHLFFPLKHLLVYRVKSKIRKDLWSQGIGRHSEQDLYGIAEIDLLAVSDILGEKKFLFGEKPCLADAGLFAFIAASAWACPESPFDVLLKSKAKNLESHARRMKELYYPDWDKIISRKSISD